MGPTQRDWLHNPCACLHIENDQAEVAHFIAQDTSQLSFNTTG